jgi:hypothetical protein
MFIEDQNVYHILKQVPGKSDSGIELTETIAPDD